MLHAVWKVWSIKARLKRWQQRVPSGRGLTAPAATWDAASTYAPFARDSSNSCRIAPERPFCFPELPGEPSGSRRYRGPAAPRGAMPGGTSMRTWGAPLPFPHRAAGTGAALPSPSSPGGTAGGPPPLRNGGQSPAAALRLPGCAARPASGAGPLPPSPFFLLLLLLHPPPPPPQGRAGGGGWRGWESGGAGGGAVECGL
ncbi:uncharacterized protein ACIB01_009658 isoform 1-T1 [Guaruba guarouba]